jgi:hypothetical protein
MITSLTRGLCLAGGLSGAALFSQYPEFTQQYTQRLAGQVDALTEVVADFDRSALDAGLTRTEALDQLQGTAFLTARNSDMQRTFARHATLSANLMTLREATPMARLMMPHRLTDTDTFQQTLGDYAPAIPVTTAGLTAAGAGFFCGWAVLTALFGMIAAMFRRKPARADPATQSTRIDPPLRRVPQSPTTPTPTLMGETR